MFINLSLPQSLDVGIRNGFQPEKDEWRSYSFNLFQSLYDQAWPRLYRQGVMGWDGDKRWEGRETRGGKVHEREMHRVAMIFAGGDRSDRSRWIPVYLAKHCHVQGTFGSPINHRTVSARTPRRIERETRVNADRVTH